MRGARGAGALVRTDPGLDRARTAANAMVSMAGSIAVVLVLARLGGVGDQQALPGVVLSTITAVTGSTALLSSPPRRVLLRAVTLWVVVSAAVALGLLAAGVGTPVHLAGTVVASFAAVWVRRFGQGATLMGLVGWLGFVLAGVLGVPPSLALSLAGDVGVAVGWMTVSTMLFRPPPVRVLRLSLASVLAGARAVVVRGDRVLATGGSRRAVRRLMVARGEVTRAALTADAQLSRGDGGDGPPTADAPGAGGERARLVDLHLAVDELARSVVALTHAQAPPAVVAAARAVVASLRAGTGPEEAVACLRAVGDGVDDVAAAVGTASPAALVLADFLDGRRTVLDPSVPVPAVRPWAPLPGTAAVLAAGGQDGTRSGALSWLHPSTRQAVQVGTAVALTVALVYALSPRYYFWAVIAAFVVYGGTSTRGETFVKAVQRVVGTAGGLTVGFFLADLLGASLTVVVVTVLVAFPAMVYWRQAAYTLATFAVSLALPVVFDALHRPLESTLELRLLETAIGAVVATLVALVVLPTHTGDVVRVAEARFDDALADLLGRAAQVLGRRDRSGVAGLDALSRAVDSRLHELGSAVGPTVRPLTPATVAGPARARLEQRARAASAARGLVSEVRTGRPRPDGDLARACCDLASAVRRGVAPSAVVAQAAVGAAGGAGADPVTTGLWHDLREVRSAYVLLAPGAQQVSGEHGGAEDGGRRDGPAAQAPSSSTPA